MAKHEVTMRFSNQGIRNEVRMRVIGVFACATPGTTL
jgi:hypothetical protein